MLQISPEKIKKWGSLALVFFLSIPVVVAAQGDDHGLTATGQNAGYDGGRDVYALIGTIISAGLGLIAILFFALALYAGIRWMTAQGNDQHVEKAKDTLRGAIIGLVITVAAYAISTFAFSRLAG
ncbi:MAG TPA: hypothetical protein VJH75_01005 [Patescibacteria group bacterium]|nr:hypothetical protein [Patescibacteria group bacterium]